MNLRLERQGGFIAEPVEFFVNLIVGPIGARCLRHTLLAAITILPGDTNNRHDYQ
jgi:hypothetical protein